MEKKISVIVPVYNEEKNIEPFLKRTKNVLTEMGEETLYNGYLENQKVALAGPD